MSIPMTVKAGAASVVMSAVIATGFLAAPVRAEAPVVKTESRMITTGGALDFGDRPKRAPRALRPSRAAASSDTPQTDWLYAFIDHLRDDSRAPAPRAARRTVAARPAALTVAPKTPPAGPAVAPPKVAAVEPALPGVTQPVITTGAIEPRPTTDLNADDFDASIIGEAEIAQARNDLIKLELARRTYDETRLSGSSAFDQRLDWRILERGRDAWTETELAAANAAGFEANTYINDQTRTIVVAIAGTQDLRRDFIEADIWRALIQAQAPQHFFLAKSYIRSVQARYQAAGFHTECVGHSLGGGACAYAGSELGLRAIVINPISAGKLADLARNYVTNYVVDGDIAAAIYALRGNELSGDIQKIRYERDAVRQQLRDRYGVLAGPIRIVRDIRNSVKVHQIERALDIIAAHAGAQRVK
jgi:hypothetical protein